MNIILEENQENDANDYFYNVDGILVPILKKVHYQRTIDGRKNNSFYTDFVENYYSEVKKYKTSYDSNVRTVLENSLERFSRNKFEAYKYIKNSMRISPEMDPMGFTLDVLPIYCVYKTMDSKPMTLKRLSIMNILNSDVNLKTTYLETDLVSENLKYEILYMDRYMWCYKSIFKYDMITPYRGNVFDGTDNVVEDKTRVIGKSFVLSEITLIKQMRDVINVEFENEFMLVDACARGAYINFKISPENTEYGESSHDDSTDDRVTGIKMDLNVERFQIMNLMNGPCITIRCLEELLDCVNIGELVINIHDTMLDAYHIDFHNKHEYFF